MRHLRVPSRNTEATLRALRDAGWLLDGGRILTDDDSDLRLIPLSQSAPESLPAPLDIWEIVSVEAPIPTPRSYRDYLTAFLSDEVVNAHSDWPIGHETMGDLIVVKLDEEIAEYGEAIAKAMLSQHARIRLVLRDDGVRGAFRVRSLTPLAARTEKGDILGVSHISPDVSSATGLLSTRTQVKESGYSLHVDPGRAYFSSRLSTEREGTLAAAARLREVIGKPLRVCDPYAGAGPSLIPLLSQPDLVGEVFAADLNPDAVELLDLNLQPFFDECGIDIDCCDATTLAARDEMRGNWDMLLVNIPHSTLDHLPAILPLLKEGSPTLLRAWAVIDEEAAESAEGKLRDLFSGQLNEEHGGLSIHPRRSYSTTQQLYRIEAWLHL
jgi:tRNA G37 N-methylase Trm5